MTLRILQIIDLILRSFKGFSLIVYVYKNLINMKTRELYIAVTVGLILATCQSKPKVIEGVSIGNAVEGSYKSPFDMSTGTGEANEEHRVEVVEVLNAEKYTYLHVKEDENIFWIAIPRKEIEVGGSYYYKGGLLKKHFHSREHNRVFETVYLVSDVLPINEDGSITNHASAQNREETREPIPMTPLEGSIKLAELITDPQKYQGKVVKITGKCVNVNPMIMQRNWVHIQDGSGDNFELTVTTNENVLLGTVVSLEGTIALNKDFGAGYRYDIIMENAVLK